MNHFDQPPTLKEDLRDSEIFSKYLECGTEADLKKLADFHKIPIEKIKLFNQFAKLRKKVVIQTWDDVVDREKNNPKATEEEMSLGGYIEVIEPQVRDAVLTMRRKGYSTYESGFYDENFQVISCDGTPFKNFEFPTNFVLQLKKQGIELTTIDNKTIQLAFESYTELDKIKQIWDQVADLLPTLDQPTTPNQTNIAQGFREKQQELSL
ncbi:hypothetical protein COT97_02870 [Candidatus Falkowbacteria bacterium CG10_big_fil_rev_8_21_14_0_10_39_11]|uniref:Uncharacterized protein n=1 Tax=Candidatus Falkowbacteria bacterium CG10_big_fil_rev_8_21_14_0_10_39_11 TaxID=1974565 RepID=A0A2H0V4Y4_9BACT|nr:MAG: hypothetical protein COT97_02870 [Candidatus Falkowbacteria bacterium CG10_big_fil_rev_8_21_14_0_10_39_11]